MNYSDESAGRRILGLALCCEFSSAGQYSIAGTFNTASTPASRMLTGTLRDNIKGRDVVLRVPGCKLN